MTKKQCQGCKNWGGDEGAYMAPCVLAASGRARTPFDEPACDEYDARVSEGFNITVTNTLFRESAKQIQDMISQSFQSTPGTPVPQNGFTGRSITAPRTKYQAIGVDSSGHIVGQDSDGKLVRIDANGYATGQARYTETQRYRTGDGTEHIIGLDAKAPLTESVSIDIVCSCATLTLSPYIGVDFGRWDATAVTQVFCDADGIYHIEAKKR